MYEEEDPTDDTVTLTRAQWQDLMKSIQSLSQANAKLVETIAFLLKKNLDSSAWGLELDEALAGEEDIYDLGSLRRLMSEGAEGFEGPQA
jgi:hypothetical protein